jgi:hypothetical protein
MVIFFACQDRQLRILFARDECDRLSLSINSPEPAARNASAITCPFEGSISESFRP